MVRSLVRPLTSPLDSCGAFKLAMVARKSASVPSVPVKTSTLYPKSAFSWHYLGAWDRPDSGEEEIEARQTDLRSAGEMSLHHSENSSVSLSWTDDDYWMSWDLWDEVIDWDEEERPAPRTRELRSSIRHPARRRNVRRHNTVENPV